MSMWAGMVIKIFINKVGLGAWMVQNTVLVKIELKTQMLLNHPKFQKQAGVKYGVRAVITCPFIHYLKSRHS